MSNVIPLLMANLALVGIVDASYLTWQKILGTVPSCNAAFKCEAVLTSQWSSIGQVPLSFLGLLFYLTLFALAFFLVLEKSSVTVFNKTLSLKILAFLLASLGGLFSLYLVWLMAFVIQAWCIFCLISAFNSFALFTLSTMYLLVKKDVHEN